MTLLITPIRKDSSVVFPITQRHTLIWDFVKDELWLNHPSENRITSRKCEDEARARTYASPYCKPENTYLPKVRIFQHYFGSPPWVLVVNLGKNYRGELDGKKFIHLYHESDYGEYRGKPFWAGAVWKVNGSTIKYWSGGLRDCDAKTEFI